VACRAQPHKHRAQRASSRVAKRVKRQIETALKAVSEIDIEVDSLGISKEDRATFKTLVVDSITARRESIKVLQNGGSNRDFEEIGIPITSSSHHAVKIDWP
jgi:hypothetical protein